MQEATEWQGGPDAAGPQQQGGMAAGEEADLQAQHPEPGEALCRGCSAPPLLLAGVLDRGYLLHSMQRDALNRLLRMDRVFWELVTSSAGRS